jgi:hypothetical protein
VTINLVDLIGPQGRGSIRPPQHVCSSCGGSALAKRSLALGCLECIKVRLAALPKLVDRDEVEKILERMEPTPP